MDTTFGGSRQENRLRYGDGAASRHGRREEAKALTENEPIHSWPVILGGKHYTHAPIAEAIVDIRCEVPADVSVDDLRSVVDESLYPNRESAMVLQGQFDLTQDPVLMQTATSNVGHVFRREDGKRVVQARRDGFSFSWLPPYDDWESFTSEAEELWLNYRSIARPTRATRIALRYVNKIDVPLSSIEITDYLRVAVDVPGYLPQAVSRYFLQVEVPLPIFECSATVASTLVPPPDVSGTSLVLDIDTWQAVDVSLQPGTAAQEVEQTLERLRIAKNHVFESCITDATRSVIA